MPTPTYTPLANITLGSTASSVTFSSISGSYRDLVLVISGSSSALRGVALSFNGDTAGNYNYVYMSGDGSSTYSGSAANQTPQNIGVTGTVIGIITLNVMDYSQTDKHKTWLSRSNVSNSEVEARAGRWASTSAITSLVATSSGSFAAGSTFALYGVSA